MRTYYLFVIRSDIHKIYCNDKLLLYKNLKNLYTIKKDNYRYGISMYKQICTYINEKLINNYLLHSEHLYKNNKYIIKLKKEITIITVRKSCIVIKTNTNIPKIFRILNYYNDKIFVCDFNNDDYFWLKNNYNKNEIYEYI